MKEYELWTLYMCSKADNHTLKWIKNDVRSKSSSDNYHAAGPRVHQTPKRGDTFPSYIPIQERSCPAADAPWIEEHLSTTIPPGGDFTPSPGNCSKPISCQSSFSTRPAASKAPIVVYLQRYLPHFSCEAKLGSDWVRNKIHQGTNFYTAIIQCQTVPIHHYFSSTA